MTTAICIDCKFEFDKKYDYMTRCFECYKKVHPKNKCMYCLDCGKHKLNTGPRCFDCWILAASPYQYTKECLDCGKDLNKKNNLTDHYKVRCYPCHNKFKNRNNPDITKYEM